MENKKLVIVIVEGPTDEIVLSVGLDKYLKNNVVKFIVYKGDITSDGRVSPFNIRSKIVSLIKNYLKLNHFKTSDLDRVIHVVDIDGTFVDKSHVYYTNHYSRIAYNKDGIYTSSVGNIIKRNEHKKANISNLISYDYISINKHRIDYDIYYNCLNLEHVFVDKRNVSDGAKKDFALETALKIDSNQDMFYTKVKSAYPLVDLNYFQSWDYLKVELNSLQRSSNLLILLNKLQNLS